MSFTTITITNAYEPQYYVTPNHTYKIGSTNDCDIQIPQHTTVFYYDSPEETFKIVNMSEEQPSPEPTPTPPEPEPTNYLKIIYLLKKRNKY